MAGVYAFPLLVELEDNNFPKLKNKLVKYFQSKKANGGDCEVDHENGSGTATLRFRREEDQRNVLKKETHEIQVDTSVLRMKVRLPTEEKKAQEAPPNTVQKKLPSGATAEVLKEAKDDEELCSNYVLGNIAKLNQEFLEMLVENIVKDADSKNYTLEIIPYTFSAVVSFPRENTDFVKKCLENRTFKNQQLSVRPLEVTTQVLAEDISLGEDILRMVFENAGGTVEKVVLNQVEQSAIITFKDHKDVQKILKKKQHFKDKELKVYPFYKSLDTALYGKDKPSLKLPDCVSETIDESLRRYLSRSQSVAAAIHNELAKHFCKVNFNQSPVCLSPEASLLQQKEAKAIIREWNQTVKSTFAEAMSKFKSLTFHPESEAWQESEDKIRQLSEREDVAVMPDKASGVILVAGPVDHVTRLEKACSEVLNEIGRRVHREKSSLTDEMRMSPSTFHILYQDGLKEKLLRVYPELKMSFIRDRSVLAITGLKDEILAANKVIYDAILALKRQHLDLHEFVLDLLKDEDLEELSEVLLISDGMNAAFEKTPHSVQLLAVSDRDLKNAGEHLRKMLISEPIDVEDEKVLKMPEWKRLVDKFEFDNSGTWRKIRIHTPGEQVVVCGHRQRVQLVTSELEDFLSQNASIEEVVSANYKAIAEYVQPRISKLGEVVKHVKVSYTEDLICLSGSRADVSKCKSRVEDLVCSVVFEEVKVVKPGVKKLFKDKKGMYTDLLRGETGCLVKLGDDADDGQDDLANRPKPVYQLQTPDGVDIAVCKADMCSYPVHAVVTSSTQNLKLDGGLAAALLKAAGPQLQDQCNKIFNSRGQLSPGECVITDAGGQLCCKKVIHAVGPLYDSNKHPKVVAQLRKAVQGSLELAEQHNCVSVALPAISRSQGFNLSVCASTIVKAVKEFCDEKYEDNCIKSIHFVNNEDTVVQAMEAAVRQEFGNHGVNPSQQVPQTKAIKSPLKQAGTSSSDPNCLGQVQTKEGLDLILMKGNIEKATTEVTVNSVVGKDLNLSQGAVSGAILREAGPSLQQLVTAQNATGAVGEIIITAGGNLKSKQVFHAVTPHWDKGKGTTEKILSGIFKDCLNKAEDTGLTSLSFPAIGTGNLGFPKDRVATLMLDRILTFSSKKPKHLKKVMIVLYSGDANTIQVFSDEFKKRFPTATAAKTAPNPPQSQGPFSKVVSTSGMHETKLGNVAIQVVTGDITKENTDVIVNSSNESFSLKSGVSKAILDAAGQAVEAECQTLITAQPNQGMIMTQPGILKCKKILHLAGQTDPLKIKKVVKDALQMCVKHSYTSVSFPAIGTGQGSVQAGQVADAMLDAAIEVLTQNTSSSLKTVRIVIFQPPMLNDFYNSMDQRVQTDKTDAKGKKGLLASFGSAFMSLFTGGAAPPQDGEDFIIEALKVDPACFHICGDTQTNVDLVKTRINELISSEINATTISEKAILHFSDADYNKIADIQRNLGVSIRTKSKNGDASITIEGLSKDVLKASTQIHKMMWEAKNKEELQKKIEMTSSLVDWQYQPQGLQYEHFDETDNYHLEQAMNDKKKTVTVKIKGQNYTVTMSKNQATNSQGQTVQIKRVNKLQAEDIPEHWDPMPDTDICKVVPINAGTQEYNEVVNLFKATCPRTVIKVERIQNRGMWKGLLVKKYDMEQRNGHLNNMRRLFHGTCHTTVDWINKYGFNRSYAGKNAACYGNGTYFAVNANYSAADTYSKPKPSGEKYMYLCQVLTGEFTTGSAGLSAPPEKTPGSFQLYDSVVDRLPTPSMFIIFHDAQAYPEYLITFK
ncbi:poly(ADP-ribose) polymerase family member 14-related sequence 1 [Betta splendens]|uniref:Poly [ADP-ribose] polymerase n=1 Tax=Betta splendens TaxID=158456 RepID=A0A6P7LCZ5_BETSP|nr:poly(ADP-ribose) polymerase family member 14-related sequence 1 [Betta splendens]